MEARVGVGFAAFGSKPFPMRRLTLFCLHCICFSGYLLFLWQTILKFFFFIFGVDLKFPFETNLFNWEKYIYFKNNTQLIELRVIDGHGKNWDGGAGATEAA